MSAKNVFIDIASKSKYFYELKEIFLIFNNSGDIALGGRKTLIEDMSPDQYDASCIMVIFAASSNYYGEMPEFRNQDMDILKDLINKVEAHSDITNWITDNIQPSLANLSKRFERVGCIDYRQA